MDVRRFYDRNRVIRRRFLDFLATLPWETLVEDRGSSYGSLRNTMLHVAEAEDWWVSFVVPGRADLWMDWDHPRRHPEPYGWVRSASEMRDAVDDVEARTLEYLDALTARELARALPLPDRPGAFGTVEDVLAHVVTHDFHHRGEMLALLSQRDVEPPRVDMLPGAP